MISFTNKLVVLALPGKGASKLDSWIEVLKLVEKRQAPELLREFGLVCRQLPFDAETAALYVAKPHWTNRFDERRESTSGIFFTVWVTPALIERSRLAYNVHSLKLRELQGYKLASRKFAEEFRQTVRPYVRAWPNISMDFGPLTLLQGYDNYAAKSFEPTVTRRVLDFVEVHQAIDRLIDKHKLDSSA